MEHASTRGFLPLPARRRLASQKMKAIREGQSLSELDHEEEPEGFADSSLGELGGRCTLARRPCEERCRWSAAECA